MVAWCRASYLLGYQDAIDINFVAKKGKKKEKREKQKTAAGDKKNKGKQQEASICGPSIFDKHAYVHVNLKAVFSLRPLLRHQRHFL